MEFQEEQFKKNFDPGLWRKVFAKLKPFRSSLTILGFTLAIVTAVDAVLPLLTLYAIDNYVVPKKIDGLTWFAIGYFVLIAVQAINIWIFIKYGGKIEIGVAYNVRREAFERLQELSFSYYDRTPVGWIMARMTSDCERLGAIISWGLIDLFWGSAVMLAMCAIMLYLNWKLAVIVLLVIPLLAWTSSKFQALILQSFRQVRKTNSRITGAFNEGIAGANTTKTLVREKQNLHEFQGLTGKMFASSLQSAIYSALFLPIVLLIGTLGSALALWFGGNGVIAGGITYGTLVAFITYTRRFFDPVQEIARVFAELQNAQASAERIFSLLETQPEIVDNKALIVSETHRAKGHVQFEQVDFCYPNGEKVLEQFNLEVKAGERVALVGETGGGKSTIVKLLCRFYEPTNGSILIDRVDYRKHSLKWLTSHLGIVLQTPHLFSGTILENIRYGKLSASDEEVKQAAQMVYAHEFIENLEDGYNSEVGEGGNLLSMGQKQLVCLARAILTNPRIFVMDEATSSVDTHTEQTIQKAVEMVLQGRTSFIIAHRLSTIRSADRIVVIEKGKIVEVGNHISLIQQQGHYYRLYTNQFQKDAVAGKLV